MQYKSQVLPKVFLCSALALLLAGCGGSRPQCVPVTGKVLIDGKPLAAGVVRVVPGKHRPATGQIQKDGTFRLTTFVDGDGCVTGTHAVEVIDFEQLSPTEKRWLVPKKYAQAATSGLTVTVDGSKADHVLELKWDGGRPFVEKSSVGGH